jgi:hypothetical protein
VIRLKFTLQHPCFETFFFKKWCCCFFLKGVTLSQTKKKTNNLMRKKGDFRSGEFLKISKFKKTKLDCGIHECYFCFVVAENKYIYLKFFFLS